MIVRGPNALHRIVGSVVVLADMAMMLAFLAMLALSGVALLIAFWPLGLAVVGWLLWCMLPSRQR